MFLFVLALTAVNAEKGWRGPRRYKCKGLFGGVKVGEFPLHLFSFTLKEDKNKTVDVIAILKEIR